MGASEKFEASEDFVDSTIQSLGALLIEGTIAHRTRLAGLTLIVGESSDDVGDVVIWQLRAKRAVIGAGSLYDASRGLTVDSAAIRPAWRGRGLYPKVLRALRELLGRRICSSSVRSPGADKAWLHAQASFDPAEERYCVNPGGARYGKSFRVMSPVGPVYRVDGAKVRKVDADGIGGWHHAVYPKLVPGNEIWIEKLAGGADEERKILAHEMVEIALMRTRGWSYQRAHNTANRAERRLRKGDCPLEVFQAVLRRHLPGRYRSGAAQAAKAFYHAYKGYR